jgi:hypothetical protein
MPDEYLIWSGLMARYWLDFDAKTNQIQYTADRAAAKRWPMAEARRLIESRPQANEKNSLVDANFVPDEPEGAGNG